MDKLTSVPDEPASAEVEIHADAPDHANDTPAGSGGGLREIDAGAGDLAQLTDNSLAAPETVHDGLGLAPTVTDDVGAAAGAGGENIAGGDVVGSDAGTVYTNYTAGVNGTMMFLDPICSAQGTSPGEAKGFTVSAGQLMLMTSYNSFVIVNTYARQ